MKLFVVSLFIVIPLVMAGIPRDMEEMFWKMVKDDSDGGKSGGDSSSDESKGKDGDMSGSQSGGMSGDMDQMMKMMMEGKWKMGDKDDDKKGGSSDSDDDDKNGKDRWGGNRSWHDDGYDDNKSGEKSSEESDDSDDSDEKEEYKKFKKWMEEKKEEKEHDKKEEELRNKIMEFKEYKKMKKDKEQEMEEKKMALYKQMKMIQEKKMMSDHLYEVSNDFMQRKRSFTYDVLTRFLGFCDCEDSVGLFQRIRKGRFGHDDDEDKDGGYSDGDGDKGGDMGDGGMPKRGNNTGDGGRGDMDVFQKPSQGEMMEFVMKFLQMSHEERLRHVVDDLVKVMCGSAKQFFAHMRQVEHYLIEFRKHSGGRDNQTDY